MVLVPAPSAAHRKILSTTAISEAVTYLEEYELERARRVLERQGGERLPTSRERKYAELLAKLTEGQCRRMAEGE